MTLIIRPMEDQDVPAVSALAGRIWRAHYAGMVPRDAIEYILAEHYTPERLRGEAASGARFTLGCDGDGILGYLTLLDEGEGRAFLKKFYIDTSRHRSGIGQRMFDYATGGLPRGGQIQLNVNCKNFKAINFYFKNGFIIERQFANDFGGGHIMEDFRMVKRLA